MSAQHTSGPFHVTGDGGDWSASHEGLGISAYVAIRDESGTVLALVVAQDTDHFATLGIIDDNARQFAAAPDLLAALRDVLRIAKAASIGITGNAPRIARAEAAIAKATGADA